jgi:hypothetical protein
MGALEEVNRRRYFSSSNFHLNLSVRCLEQRDRFIGLREMTSNTMVLTSLVCNDVYSLTLAFLFCN